MKQSNSRYFKNYFKHNGVVLICELLIVLLLSLICTILLKAQPKWLAPVLAVAAYVLAELRFMMAYVAKCVKRDHLLAQQAREAEEDDVNDEPTPAPVAPAPVDDIDADDEEDEDDIDAFDEEEENEDEAEEEYYVESEADEAAYQITEEAESTENAVDEFVIEEDEVSEASDAEVEEIEDEEDDDIFSILEDLNFEDVTAPAASIDDFIPSAAEEIPVEEVDVTDDITTTEEVEIDVDETGGINHG